MLFSDSGEITKIEYYKMGNIHNINELQSQDIEKNVNQSYKIENQITGLYYDTSISTITCSFIKSGKNDGVTWIKSKAKPYSKKYFIYFQSKKKYLINCDKNDIPISYHDLITPYSNFYVTGWSFKKGELKLKYFNPEKTRTLVPSLRSRTLSYKSKFLRKEYYKYINDTLIIYCKKDPTGKAFTDGLLENSRNELKFMNVQRKQFVEILLFPYQEAVTIGKFVLPKFSKPSYIILITENGDYVLDKTLEREKIE